ncbi:hypothetical protein HMPREF9120_02735 [Neisseria sp. oral taxon 020 str. F0370]|nr:hypothetical protein HMPREF9120_02735 [Neisseria sp. oral taxon 020 str. F0370]
MGDCLWGRWGGVSGWLLGFFRRHQGSLKAGCGRSGIYARQMEHKRERVGHECPTYAAISA